MTSQEVAMVASAFDDMSVSTNSIAGSSEGAYTKKSLDSIRLKPNLRHNLNKLYRVPIQRLDCTFSVVTKQAKFPIKEAMEREARSQKADVMILLATRRPGWGNCREHGEQLSQLAAAKNAKTGRSSRIGLVGVVKEAGDDNANIAEFSEQHFKNYPVYMDEKWYIYKALGKRTLSLETLKAGVQRHLPRYKRKNIPMRFEGGDRYVMGGVLIFDRRGNLRFAYEEAYGEELDMDVIREAIAEIRGRSDSNRSIDTMSEYSFQTSSSIHSQHDQRFL